MCKLWGPKCSQAVWVTGTGMAATANIVGWNPTLRSSVFSLFVIFTARVPFWVCAKSATLLVQQAYFYMLVKINLWEPQLFKLAFKDR